jgi:hypothetical protein
MKYSNKSNYRDYLMIEIKKIVDDLDHPKSDKKNFLVNCIFSLKQKIFNIFSNPKNN